MLNYDKRKNILYGYKTEVARPNLRPDNSNNVVYQSFIKYINEHVADDVMEVFLPRLMEVTQAKPELFGIDRDSIRVKTIDPGNYNDKTHHVTAEFIIQGFNNAINNMGDVTLIKLPHVGTNGIIEYDSKQYAFIHMLEQEPAISYEANENTRNAAAIKIKNGTRSIWLEEDPRKIKFCMSDRRGAHSKTKYTLINLIAAMAWWEGYDIYKIWDEYANFTITNMFKDDAEKRAHLEYYGKNVSTVNASDYVKDVAPRLMQLGGEDEKTDIIVKMMTLKMDPNGTGDDSYSNMEIRDGINHLLSLDRAIGEVLMKDVESVLNPGRILARAGSTVDDNMVMLFKSEGVYKIYIKYIPNIEGYYLAEPIIINYAPQGLRITDELREYFPDEEGMYTSKFYSQLPQPIFYEAGDVLTESMINVISAFGRDSITVKDKRSGGFVKTLNFYEEIMSNRQYQGELIGLEPGEWYYLDKDFNFVKTDGKYTTYDFVALQSFCVKLFEGKWIERVVNSDAGFRKMLVPLEEQYKRAFRYAVREGFKQMSRKFKTIYQNNRFNFTNRDLIDNDFYPFSKYFWQYLRDNAKCLVSLQSDNVHNPIAFQSACTKVNVYTANKHSVAASQRDIAIGSFGKIDPYEIPQSQKMGTVYNSTCDVEISTDGKMRTMYYEVTHLGGRSRIMFNKPQFFTSAQEEQYVIADICSLEFDQNGFILDTNKAVLCRVPANSSIEKQGFAHRMVREIKYVNASATQSLSWASATIPFMNSNDAARAVFAVAQEKAAKGLVDAEEPDVITSAYEQFVWLNDKFGIIARHDGTIVQVEHLWKEDSYQIGIEYDNGENVIHEFKEYFNSGYSVTKMKILVKPGDRVAKGDMIVSSNFISDRGILMFGRNALTGFISTGYNYEDGSNMSTSFGESMSSYRINEESFQGSPSRTKSHHVTGYPSGKWVKEGDTVDVDYMDSRFIERVSKTAKLTKAYGFVEDTEPIKNEHGKGNYGTVLKTVSVDRFNTGDKSSNRHGNKGVLSDTRQVVADDSIMPRLMNGMPLDVCLNPLGVGSRMNIGQVKEIHCGLIAHVLRMQISTDAYNCISGDEIKRLMSFTVDLMNSTGDPTSVFTAYSDLIDIHGGDFMQHCMENIDLIRIYAGCFNKNGTTRLILPDNGGRLTETEVLVGYIYIFKLIQESHKKVHARGGEPVGEPYGELTDAPTHGSSKGGGQRFGTMEMNAICAYGASAYAQELTNERCDNAIARDNLYINTYLPPKIRGYYRIDSRGQRRSVTQFLYTLLALGVMAEPTAGEFIPLSYNNGEDLAHWKPSVLQRAKGYQKTDSDDEGAGSDTEPVVATVPASTGDPLLDAANAAGVSVVPKSNRDRILSM